MNRNENENYVMNGLNIEREVPCSLECNNNFSCVFNVCVYESLIL